MTNEYCGWKDEKKKEEQIEYDYSDLKGFWEKQKRGVVKIKD